jgi:hypothetical protein
VQLVVAMACSTAISWISDLVTWRSSCRCGLAMFLQNFCKCYKSEGLAHETHYSQLQRHLHNFLALQLCMQDQSDWSCHMTSKGFQLVSQQWCNLKQWSCAHKIKTTIMMRAIITFRSARRVSRPSLYSYICSFSIKEILPFKTTMMVGSPWPTNTLPLSWFWTVKFPQCLRSRYEAWLSRCEAWLVKKFLYRT